jgi:hypothetical protein
MSRQGIKDFGGYPRDSDSVLRSKSSVTKEASFEGYNGSGEYPDRAKDILKTQQETVSKYRGQKMKEGYRN